MVYDFPTDSLHLMDLGVMRKLLACLLDGKYMSKNNVERLSETMFQLKPYVPKDMGRKPRRLSERKHFKGSEYRLFSLYIGIVVLKDKLGNEYYEHFLCFAVAYRLLSMHTNWVVPQEYIELAKKLIKIFVENFQRLYGETTLCYNIHVLLHLCSFVQKYGPLDSFSSYRYENMYQKVKKRMRRATQLPQQLYNRWLEFRGTNKESKYDKQKYTKKEPDNCVTLKNGKICLISKMRLSGNDYVYFGAEFNSKSNYFERPVESRVVGIYKVHLNDLSTTTVEFTENDIQCKNVLFPTFIGDRAVVLPILHYL